MSDFTIPLTPQGPETILGQPNPVPGELAFTGKDINVTMSGEVQVALITREQVDDFDLSTLNDLLSSSVGKLCIRAVEGQSDLFEVIKLDT